MRTLLSAILLAKDRTTIEEYAFRAARKIGHRHFAYLPIAPLLDPDQVISDFPETFHRQYNELDWFASDLPLSYGYTATTPFYLTDIESNIASNDLRCLRVPGRFLKMVGALKSFGVDEVLYVPLPMEDGQRRIVLLGSGGLDRSEEGYRDSLLLAKTVHLSITESCSQDFELPDHERGMKILAMLAKGMTSEEIGVELGYNKKTVDKVISDLMVKMDCSTRIELAVRAVRLGLID